jgi:xylan 1,4-beta-xylosidase
LTHYYNRHKFHKLLICYEPDIGRCLRVVSCLGDYADNELTWHGDAVAIPDGPVQMQANVDHADLQFSWRMNDSDWIPIGGTLDATLISDEAGFGEHGSFTGGFVGMYAMDITGQGREALFSHFSYTPHPKGGV